MQQYTDVQRTREAHLTSPGPLRPVRLDSTIMEIAMHRQIAPCILHGQRRGGIVRAMHQMMAIFGI